jgi:hypothetical protein
MKQTFEKVYTATKYHDGPREGIADFDGGPHLYKAIWNEEIDDYGSSFLLSPLSDETFQLALESWAIWRRWKTAFIEGKVQLQQNRQTLPEDRNRQERLMELLGGQLVVDPLREFKARGQFRNTTGLIAGGPELGPWEVHWELLTAT